MTWTPHSTPSESFIIRILDIRVQPVNPPVTRSGRGGRGCGCRTRRRAASGTRARAPASCPQHDRELDHLVVADDAQPDRRRREPADPVAAVRRARRTERHPPQPDLADLGERDHGGADVMTPGAHDVVADLDLRHQATPQERRRRASEAPTPAITRHARSANARRAASIGPATRSATRGRKITTGPPATPGGCHPRASPRPPARGADHASGRHCDTSRPAHDRAPAAVRCRRPIS